MAALEGKGLPTSLAWLEVPLLVAVPAGSGWMALRRRVLIALRRPGGGEVVPVSGAYDEEWLDYAALALRCALRLGAGVPAGEPGADLLVAHPSGSAGPERTLAGGSASFPIALALLTALAGGGPGRAVYASGFLAGEDGALRRGRRDAIAAKAALLDHLHPRGDFVLFAPPHGDRPVAGVTVVSDVSRALAVLDETGGRRKTQAGAAKEGQT